MTFSRYKIKLGTYKFNSIAKFRIYIYIYIYIYMYAGPIDRQIGKRGSDRYFYRTWPAFRHISRSLMFRFSHNWLRGCSGQPFLPVGEPKVNPWVPDRATKAFATCVYICDVLQPTFRVWRPRFGIGRPIRQTLFKTNVKPCTILYITRMILDISTESIDLKLRTFLNLYSFPSENCSTFYGL